MGSLSNDMQKTISNVGTTLSKSLEDGMENGGNLVDSMSGSMVGLGTTSTTVRSSFMEMLYGAYLFVLIFTNTK